MGQLFKLDNLRGDAHAQTMCERAHSVKDFVVHTHAERARSFRALLWAMGTQPKSKAVAEYRRQIALYLEGVREATGWKLVQMGQAAGGLKHTTISRALKQENTMNYPSLLVLEASSHHPIPEALKTAARLSQQAAYPQGPTEATISRVAEELANESPEVQRALIERLQRNLAKTG